jgi:hypothetical protein
MEKITQLQEEINKEFGEVIFFSFDKCSVAKRLAICAVSDMIYITILRQGFCLLPFEYMVEIILLLIENRQLKNY